MPERQVIKPLLMRQLFTLVTIVILGILIFTPLRPYMTGLFGAVIMFVLTFKAMDKLTQMGWKRWLSATLLIIATIFVILIPVSLILLLLTNRVREVVANSDKYTYMLKSSIANIENQVGFDLTSAFDNGSLEQMVSQLVSGAAGSTLDFTIIIGLMYFSLYYLLINYDTVKEDIRTYTPLSNKNYERVITESKEMIKSNAIAIPLVALLQGGVALIGFLIFGAPNPWFWFAVTTIGSMIPFIGTALGMVPIVIIMYTQGHTYEAVGLAIYGMAVVGSTDNIFRMFLQSSLASIHPMITLIGVIIGIPLFGFMGLVFGPLIVSLFLLMVKIYKEEYL